MKLLSPALLSAGLFLATFSFAQPTGTIAFDETTPYSHGFRKIIKTSDGGLLAIGSAGPNGRVTKLNASFAQVWSLAMDSMPFLDLAETNDGNYVLLGMTLNAAYNSAPCILKLTPAGVTVYQKTYYSSASGNQFYADGLCKAAGSDNGFLLFGGNCVAMDYLMKCDVNGNISWQQQYAGTGNGAFAQVIPVSNGYTGIFNCMQNSVASIGILNVDASGNVQWCKVMQSANGVAPVRNTLVQKNNGDYYFTVSPYDVNGLQNYTVSANGSTVTCKRHVTGSQMSLTSVTATGNANDETLITGMINTAFYLKVDAADDIVYQKTYGSLLSSEFNGCAKMGNGTYALCGSSSWDGKVVALVDENGNGACNPGNASFTTAAHSFTLTSPSLTVFPVNAQVTSLNHMFYAVTQAQTTLCGTVSVPGQESMPAEVSVYPNPAEELIFIGVSKGEMRSLRLRNALGQVCIAEKKVSDVAARLELSGLPAGVYFLEVNCGERVIVRKITKR